MSPWTPESGRRLAPDQRRAELVTVARRLFALHGYSAVSSSDIAHAAGTARALINHYFGSKRGLYLETVRQVLLFPPSVAENLPPTSTEERVSICVTRWLDSAERDRDTWLSALVLAEIGRDDDVAPILLEADEIATNLLLHAAMMSDVVAGRTELRGMLRAYGAMLRSATHEWLAYDTFSRDQVHTVLTSSALQLLHVVFPQVRGETTRCAEREASDGQPIHSGPAAGSHAAAQPPRTG